MKIDSLGYEEPQLEERKMQQEKHLRKVIVNSIEPKIGHFLFEFILENGYFRIFQSNWRTENEIVYIYKSGKFVKKQHEPIKIDLFDPDFKAVKKSNLIEQKDGVGYVTALNYDNAVRKFKNLNPEYFS